MKGFVLEGVAASVVAQKKVEGGAVAGFRDTAGNDGKGVAVLSELSTCRQVVKIVPHPVDPGGGIDLEGKFIDSEERILTRPEIKQVWVNLNGTIVLVNGGVGDS